MEAKVCRVRAEIKVFNADAMQSKAATVSAKAPQHPQVLHGIA